MTNLERILARPIAHRGLHDRRAGLVENSVAAARAAIAGGFGIECDVQLSADGEAMVFHDDSLDRLTGATGPVGSRAAADLAAIPLHGGQEGIPDLPTFLATLGGRVPLVIEIKSGGDGDLRLARRTVALVYRYGGPVALKSFDPLVMAVCREAGARCPLGLVGPRHDPAGRDIAPPDLGGYDFLSWKLAALPALRAHEPSRPLMSWTVRSREDHDEAAEHRAQIVFEGYRPA